MASFKTSESRTLIMPAARFCRADGGLALCGWLRPRPAGIEGVSLRLCVGLAAGLNLGGTVCLQCELHGDPSTVLTIRCQCSGSTVCDCLTVVGAMARSPSATKRARMSRRNPRLNWCSCRRRGADHSRYVASATATFLAALPSR